MANRVRRTAVVESGTRSDDARVESLLGHCRKVATDGTLLLAQQGPELVGVAVLRLELPDAEILALVTDPNFRHRGIGRALVLELARRARAAGCERLRIHFPRSDDAALAFFRALGFDDTWVALDLVL